MLEAPNSSKQIHGGEVHKDNYIPQDHVWLRKIILGDNLRHLYLGACLLLLFFLGTCKVTCRFLA